MRTFFMLGAFWGLINLLFWAMYKPSSWSDFAFFCSVSVTFALLACAYRPVAPLPQSTEGEKNDGS